MNGSGVKGVGIDIGSALDLYIFMGLLFLVSAPDLTMAGGYFDLEEAMVDFVKDCELSLESDIPESAS